MTPKEFLKTDKATDFEDVAFTAEQWNAVYAWMNDFLTHEGQSLPIQNVSFSLRDKFAMEAMNGELSAQNFETGEHWANEVYLAERAYLVADAMIKARSNES